MTRKIDALDGTIEFDHINPGVVNMTVWNGNLGTTVRLTVHEMSHLILALDQIREDLKQDPTK